MRLKVLKIPPIIMILSKKIQTQPLLLKIISLTSNITRSANILNTYNDTTIVIGEPTKIPTVTTPLYVHCTIQLSK